MIREPKVPLHKARTIKNISEAVSHLVMPDLSQLIQLFTDMRSSVNKDRTVLLRQKEQTKTEGYAAATRLMLLDPTKWIGMNDSYFDRINHDGD